MFSGSRVSVRKVVGCGGDFSRVYGRERFSSRFQLGFVYYSLGTHRQVQIGKAAVLVSLHRAA